MRFGGFFLTGLRDAVDANRYIIQILRASSGMAARELELAVATHHGPARPSVAYTRYSYAHALDNLSLAYQCAGYGWARSSGRGITSTKQGTCDQRRRASSGAD